MEFITGEPLLGEETFHSIVVGGGMFGCHVATELARLGRKVLLVEVESQLVGRASYINQARVHGGYHYPRSFLTASRSRANFFRFAQSYSESVVDDVQSYYAIGKKFSWTTAKQFQKFCQQIGAPLIPASKSIRQLFNLKLVEEVFAVQEYVFDANRLRERLERDLRSLDVTVMLGSEGRQVGLDLQGKIWIDVARQGEINRVPADEIWLCTYSALNGVLKNSSLPLVPLKYELAEMALIEMPPELQKSGVTMMDGPFFSIMPFPSRRLHTLSHVRYTPHCAWSQTDVNISRSVLPPRDRLPPSNFFKMKKDVARFLPVVETVHQHDSLWEIKALMPRSEDNDSRPILLRRDHGIPGLHCILGAKIDNVFDITIG